MAYFSLHLFIFPFFDSATPLSRVSSALEILARHLSCSLLTRSSAAPMTVMMMEASRAKVPSQTYSAVSKVDLPAVSKCWGTKSVMFHAIRIGTWLTECADDAGADDEADEQTESRAGPDLADQALTDFGISVGAQGLLEKGEQDGDNDAGFETFSEADKEDYRIRSVFVSFASS
jgi:hypothetical protein